MSADEFDRPAVRLVRAASANLAEANTAAIVMPQPVRGGCRSTVDGRRCGHAKSAHLQVGFYAGERHRCACGCKAYVSPIEPLIIGLAAIAIAVPTGTVILFLLWSVLEALT